MLDELIRTNLSMAPEIVEVQEEALISIMNAMTAMRRVRSYLQATSAPPDDEDDDFNDFRIRALFSLSVILRWYLIAKFTFS